MIQLKNYTFKEIPLSIEILTIYIEKFWSEVFKLNEELI
jgi:hypothetical protein